MKYSKVMIDVMRRTEGSIGFWIRGPHGRFLLWLADTGLPTREAAHAVLVGLYKAYTDPEKFKAEADSTGDPEKQLEAEKLVDAAKTVGPAIVDAAKAAGIA